MRDVIGKGSEVEIRGLNTTEAAFKRAARQIPFVTSLAMNRTLAKVQKWTVSIHLRRRFTLRKRGVKGWWDPKIKTGFKVKVSSRKNQVARLGSIAPWLGLQEHGGKKRGSGGHRIAIPTLIHKPHSDILKKAKRPKALVAKMSSLKKARKPRPFFSDHETSTLPRGIWIRVGKGRLPIMPLFLFFSEVSIPKRLQFEHDAAIKAWDLYPREFGQAFKDAITKPNNSKGGPNARRLDGGHKVK